MRTVLVDTNVLIGLVDRSDDLHERAANDLTTLSSADLRVTTAVLVESTFALPRADQRGRLSLLLDRLPILPLAVDDEASLRREVFSWLARYAEHVPDYADGELCVVAGHDKRRRVWSYDHEFKSVWRKPDGKRVPLIGQ